MRAISSSLSTPLGLFIGIILLSFQSILAQPSSPSPNLACGSFYQDMMCREDCGTCGTACCGLEFDISMTVQTFVQTFERTMRANGTDGQYRYVDQDARDLPNMLQATWRPPPDGSAVDRNEKFLSTINCNVRLATPSPPVVTAVCHSQSNLVQTYCDRGRNYKILENLLLSMDVQNYVQRTNFGCPLKDT